MDGHPGTCPLTRRQIIDEYFLENRARALDIAAFLDRMDRAADGPGADEFRMQAFRQALAVLCSSTPGRAREIQMLLSDPTREPVEELRGKGAVGAYDGGSREER